jgi:hypothetical protein
VLRSSSDNAFRSVLLPDGSPIEPVAPPIFHQPSRSEARTNARDLCPLAVKCSNPRRGSRLPTCNEEAEGSTPE